MSPRKDKAVKKHRLVLPPDALEEHARIARLGEHDGITDHVLQVVAAMHWAAEAKRDAEILNPDDTPSGIIDPRALPEYERRVAIVGRWVADVMLNLDATSILHGVAEAITVCGRLDLNIDERPDRALPAAEVLSRFNGPDGPIAVRWDDLIREVEKQGLQVPKVLRLKPADPVRLRLVIGVRIFLRFDPTHQFSTEELRRWVTLDECSAATLKRAVKELGIPMVRRGAPKGTKQNRIRR